MKGAKKCLQFVIAIPKPLLLLNNADCTGGAAGVNERVIFQLGCCIIGDAASFDCVDHYSDCRSRFSSFNNVPIKPPVALP